MNNRDQILFATMQTSRRRYWYIQLKLHININNEKQNEPTLDTHLFPANESDDANDNLNDEDNDDDAKKLSNKHKYHTKRCLQTL